MTDADRILLHAALDGELDALALDAFERRLSAEPDLAREFNSLKALRSSLRALPAQRAPGEFRARIEALAAAPAAPVASQPPATARRAPLMAIAASVAALGIGLVAGARLAPTGGGADVERQILAGHLRGMMSSRPVDVVSSDQHTVKPWFAGKLAVAPVVIDLAAEGYPLEGGRIDVIDGEPAATLVYRAGKHVVSVTRLPPAAQGAAIPAHREIDGHALVRWSDGGATYVAASDAAPAEVEALAAAFRKSAASFR